jgi:hypothetical protein
MVLLSMKLPIAIPMIVEAHGSQVEHGLRPGFRPTHAGRLQALLHQMPTGAFDNSSANRPAPCQVRIIAPIGAVALVVTDRAPYGLAWRRRVRGVMCLGRQGGDDRVDLACQQRLQVRTDPGHARRMSLPQQGVGRVPQLRYGMDEVQDPGVPRNVRHPPRLQRLGAIGEGHARLEVGPVALGDPRRQTAHGHGLSC